MGNILKELEKVHWLHMSEVIKRTVFVLIIIAIVAVSFVFYEFLISKTVSFLTFLSF